jgi:hypothetical protein
MTEEFDLQMTHVWEALEVGLRMIEEENRKERQEKARFEKDLDGAKRMLVVWLPDVMQPYAKLLDLEVVEDAAGGINPDYGWFAVKIPDLALITAYVKQGTPPEIKYWVHDPTVVEIGLDDDFDRTVAYHRLNDHRIALARAYELMKKHMWETNGSVPGIPSVTKEPHSEPIQEEVNEITHKQVLEKIRIEEVIEQNYGWKLEKHNKFLIALKDRSLIVDPEKHIYYWNSQGENGNVIDFVMQREGLSYEDAVCHLSEIYNSCNAVVEPEYVPLQDEINERIAAIDGAKVKKNLLKIPLDVLYGFLKSIRIEDVITDSGWNLKPNSEDDPNYLVDEGMHVNVKLQTFHWGNKTGGVIDWIMQSESMNWAEAVGELIDRYWGKFGKKIEPEYVPLEEELAHSDSEFDSPLVAFLSNYTLNELMNFIDSRIDLRFSQIKN